MADRRTFLRGLAALPLAGVALPALANLSAATEPLVTLRQRFAELLAQSRINPESEMADAALEAAADLRGESFDLRATTPAGALASLEWAREEFGRHYVEEPKEPDWLDVWTLAMIDSAIGVLHVIVKGGAG